MWKQSMIRWLLGLSLLCSWFGSVDAFIQPSPEGCGSSLFAGRQPRRFLKKRKGRDRKRNANVIDTSTGHPNDEIEIKPLIGYKRKEAGEDFWIDPKDMAKEKKRQQAISNRKAIEGEMSKEKLMTEVVAPYKQNWIGVFSVVVVVLAVLVINFPEMLENPSIGFPDLDAGEPIPLQVDIKRAMLEQ